MRFSTAGVDGLEDNFSEDSISEDNGIPEDKGFPEDNGIPEDKGFSGR